MPSQSQQNANVYLRTKVMSASPEELRMMLLDGALRFAQQGRDGLIAGDHEASYNGFSQSRNIVVELISSMREEVNPELCDRVRSLYTFIYSELVGASFEKDIQRATNAIELLAFECDTWRQLMDKLASDRQSDASQIDQPEGQTPPASAPPAPDPARPSLSLRG